MALNVLIHVLAEHSFALPEKNKIQQQQQKNRKKNSQTLMKKTTTTTTQIATFRSTTHFTEQRYIKSYGHVDTRSTLKHMSVRINSNELIIYSQKGIGIAGAI